MNTENAVKSVIDSLYSQFIMRDFAYLASGTLFLFVVLLLFDRVDLIFISSTTIASKTAIAIFFGAAYFTGIFMQEACIYLGIFNMVMGRGPDGTEHAEQAKDNGALYRHLLYKNKVDPKAMATIERSSYLKQVASAFGSAAFFSIVCVIIDGFINHCYYSSNSLKELRFPHGLTLLVGIPLFSFCLIENKIKRNLQFKSIYLLRWMCVPEAEIAATERADIIDFYSKFNVDNPQSPPKR